MTRPLEQHLEEIQANRRAWNSKPVLRDLYERFYAKIAGQIDPSVPGRLVEIGSGIGNLRSVFPEALATDLWPNPWLDVVCDGYEMPFPGGSLSHLILFDVFHHLEAPMAFFREARRVLHPNGRLILFEPFISWTSWPVYGLAHHEPVGWTQPISTAPRLSPPRDYYAAQGNATRLFFQSAPPTSLPEWRILEKSALAGFAYLLSGGFSKPSLYPPQIAPVLHRLDAFLSRWPSIFACRCLVTLTPA